MISLVCVDELTEVELGDLPASCVARSKAFATASSKITWNNLLGSCAADICSNAETSSSHWLCDSGPILPSFLNCCHRNLSFATLQCTIYLQIHQQVQIYL